MTYSPFFFFCSTPFASSLEGGAGIGLSDVVEVIEAEELPG